MSKEKGRKKAYELIEGRRTRNVSRDSVEAELQAEERELAREARRLRLEEVVAKRRKKLESIEGKTGGEKSSKDVDALIKNLLTNPRVQKDWLSLDDDQRNVILTSISTLQSTRGGSLEGMGLAVPLMMLQMRQNPSTNIKDMVELIQVVSGGKGKGDEGKTIVEAIKLGLDMAKENRPKGSGESILKDAMGLLKPIYETLSNKDKELYNQQFEWLKNQIVSPRDMIKSIGENAAALGYQKGGSNLEIEKLKIDQDRWKTEMEWKREDRLLDMQLREKSEDRRWKAIQEIGTKWMDKAGPVLDAGIEAAQTRIRGTGTGSRVPVKTPKLKATKAIVQCKDCGTPNTIDISKGYPDEFKCEKCGVINYKQPLK